MLLTLLRIALLPTYTIGRLYINGKYICDTLEDTVREGKKISGQTAIPAGTYTLSYTYSPHFSKLMPLVESVTNFSGVRIHPGNTPEDTDGCILVGQNKIKGQLINSVKCFDAVIKKIKAATALKETIKIKIINPQPKDISAKMT
jgi:hypothetical protein